MGSDKEERFESVIYGHNCVVIWRDSEGAVLKTVGLLHMHYMFNFWPFRLAMPRAVSMEITSVGSAECVLSIYRAADGSHISTRRLAHRPMKLEFQPLRCYGGSIELTMLSESVPGGECQNQ